MSLALVFFFFPLLSEAKLQRNKNPLLFNFSSTIQTRLRGVIKEGVYYSPEETCIFQIPQLSKAGLFLNDFSDGVELRATFKDSLHLYQIDIFKTEKFKTVFDLFNFEYQNIKLDKFLFKGILEEKFDMSKKGDEIDIFVIIEKSEDKNNFHLTRNTAYLQANSKIYKICSLSNWNDFPDEKGKRTLTDSELVEKGKASILDLLSRFYIHTLGQFDEKKSDSEIHSDVSQNKTNSESVKPEAQPLTK